MSTKSQQYLPKLSMTRAFAKIMHSYEERESWFHRDSGNFTVELPGSQIQFSLKNKLHGFHDISKSAFKGISF